jgi:glycosyltransferase involved in cell wall biosynthesis
MKTVLFDLYYSQPLGKSKFHGGGEYIKTVYKALLKNYLDKCNLVVFYDDTKFLDDWILESFEKFGVEKEIVHSLEELEGIFARRKIDVFYSGLPYSYWRKVKIPSGVVKRGTVHGLRGLELMSGNFSRGFGSDFRQLYLGKKQRIRYFIDCFKKKYLMKIEETSEYLEYKNCLDFLDEIVCVSNHTKYALMNFFPQVKKEIRVFYTPAKYLNVSVSDEPVVKGRYVLLLGMNRYEKNCFRALSAMKKLREKGFLKDVSIVTVGNVPEGVQKKAGNRLEFINFGYLDAERLENLYKFAEVFVYPSLNEGFGMPPLEAMKYNKTCIVSAICSLPEVCQDSVYYFDPYNEDEIQNRLLMALENKIPEEKIANHLKAITEKQDEDLDKLCEFIVS